MNKKKHEFPHAFVILFAILVLMVSCTWLVPAGQYNRVDKVDVERNLILVKGSIPGAAGSFVVIKETVKPNK